MRFMFDHAKAERQLFRRDLRVFCDAWRGGASGTPLRQRSQVEQHTSQTFQVLAVVNQHSTEVSCGSTAQITQPSCQRFRARQVTGARVSMRRTLP